MLPWLIDLALAPDEIAHRRAELVQSRRERHSWLDDLLIDKGALALVDSAYGVTAAGVDGLLVAGDVCNIACHRPIRLIELRTGDSVALDGVASRRRLVTRCTPFEDDDEHDDYAERQPRKPEILPPLSRHHVGQRASGDIGQHADQDAQDDDGYFCEASSHRGRLGLRHGSSNAIIALQ